MSVMTSFRRDGDFSSGDSWRHGLPSWSSMEQNAQVSGHTCVVWVRWGPSSREPLPPGSRVSRALRVCPARLLSLVSEVCPVCTCFKCAQWPELLCSLRVRRHHPHLRAGSPRIWAAAFPSSRGLRGSCCLPPPCHRPLLEAHVSPAPGSFPLARGALPVRADWKWPPVTPRPGSVAGEERPLAMVRHAQVSRAWTERPHTGHSVPVQSGQRASRGPGFGAPSGRRAHSK